MTRFLRTTAVVVIVLVGAAFLLWLYLPKNVGISYLSSGAWRGVPVNAFAFWLLIIAAIAVAIVYIFRRVIA